MLFLVCQAALRQQELGRSLQWANENDLTLRQIQESLANTDRHLSAYLADHVDAQQIPQEAQVSAVPPPPRHVCLSSKWEQND